MQLALTTSLQLVCVRKQATKQPLLTSPWPTKIVNIFLKDSSACCGTRSCTYFEGGVAFPTLIASQTYKMIPTSLRSEDDDTDKLTYFRCSVTQPCPFLYILAFVGSLTTSLQLVCVRKQATKQPLLTSPWPTKIVNIFLKDSSACCGTRSCTYFEGGVAFPTLLASQTYKMIPTSLRSEDDDTDKLTYFRCSVTQPCPFLYILAFVGSL